MLMSCQRYVLLVTVVLTLLGIHWRETATASDEKDYASLSFPLPDRPLKIRSTHPVVTHHKNAIPLGDTFCVCDETGQALMCSGVEKPTPVHCLPHCLSEKQNPVRCPQGTGAGNNTNILVLSASTQAFDVITQGAIYSEMSNIQPLRDTYCTTDDTGQGLTCKGIEDPTSLRIPPTSGETLYITSSTPDTSNTCSDVTIMGVSTEGLEGLLLPEAPELDAWAAHCKKIVKTEPVENEYTGSGITPSEPERAIVTKNKKTICSGCQQDFLTANKLSSHRKTSKEAACKAGLNTTCACGKSFEAASLLQSHRQTSKEAACKAGLNTTCACGTSFEAVNLLQSHRQTSKKAACKAGLNTTCACGTSFKTASLLQSHRQTSKEAACKAGRNTTCACGTPFETARLLQSHRQTSKEAACKAGLNTTCACGTSFETANLLKSHRQASKEAACKAGLNTTCACGTSFETVRLLQSHRQNSKEAACKAGLNTTCACGTSFETASLLKSHRQNSKEAACKAGLNTTCACGTSFETVSLLQSHRHTSKEAACKAGLNTTCACGQSFETVRLLQSHRQTSKEAACKVRIKKQKVSKT